MEAGSDLKVVYQEAKGENRLFFPQRSKLEEEEEIEGEEHWWEEKMKRVGEVSSYLVCGNQK